MARLAKHHFAPTSLERLNLIGEGIEDRKISIVGNTIGDSVSIILQKLEGGAFLRSSEEKDVVVTLHRRELLLGGMARVLREIKIFAYDSGEGVQIHFPIHPNPDIKREVERELRGVPHIHLLDPLAYPQFIALLSRASLVVTDSGGVQEEAALLGRPTLIVRDQTERRNGLGKNAFLAKPDELSHHMRGILTRPFPVQEYRVTQVGASKKIVSIVRERLLA